MDSHEQDTGIAPTTMTTLIYMTHGCVMRIRLKQLMTYSELPFPLPTCMHVVLKHSSIEGYYIQYNKYFELKKLVWLLPQLEMLPLVAALSLTIGKHNIVSYTSVTAHTHHCHQT